MSELPFLAVDRQHELQGEADEAYDEAVAAAARKNAADICHKATAGDDAMLHDLYEALSHRLSNPDISKTLIRTALSCAPDVAGQMYRDLVQKCIDEKAELDAEAEVKTRQPQPRLRQWMHDLANLPETTTRPP